jgi:predicted  nucleic acid-binding Zn-ribbon protein
MLAPDLKTLEKMMLAYNKAPFTQNQVVPATTRVRKQLEAWLYANSAPPASRREQELDHLHEQIRRLEELYAFEASRIRKLTRLRDATNDADEYIELDRQLQSAIAMEQTHAIGLDRARTRIRELENKKAR